MSDRDKIIFFADESDTLKVKAGSEFFLNSITVPVVPPFLMVTPYIDSTPGILVLSSENEVAEGVRTDIYRISIRSEIRKGIITTGVKDMHTGKVLEEKSIVVLASK